MIRPFVASLAVLLCIATAEARDDGRYANSTLKSWFDSLHSKKGPCCSVTDGATVEDVDWDTDGGHYRVRMAGQWLIVPDDAIVTVPNKFGRPVVWPYVENGETKIRCFIAGAGG